MKYTISQFDGETWQVIEDDHELCIVSNYEGHEDAYDRAGKIIAAMANTYDSPAVSMDRVSYERRSFNPQPKPEKGKGKR